MTIRAQDPDHLFEPRRVFSLLVIYRWISLIPPLVLWVLMLSSDQSQATQLSALAIALTLNILISLFHDSLNQILLERPWLLLVDLLLIAGLIVISGGWRTPYYLYALSPLLAAAFFFRSKGALAAGLTFVCFYLLAVVVASRLNDVPPQLADGRYGQRRFPPSQPDLWLHR